MLAGILLPVPLIANAIQLVDDINSHAILTEIPSVLLGSMVTGLWSFRQ